MFPPRSAPHVEPSHDLPASQLELRRAPATTERRLLRRRVGTAEPAWGLKVNPWLRLNAVVTMFDSGAVRASCADELGVRPGDILRCALTLARNEAEARRVLLTRLSTVEHARLGGHTGGNLLLSMMERYSGDFLAAVDGLRALLGCTGHVWPVSVESSSVCAEYSDGQHSRGEVAVDAAQTRGHFVKRIWLEPSVRIHPVVDAAIRQFDAAVIGPGSFYTSLLPLFLVEGVRDALREVRGPIVLVANLLTEGPGMRGFTAGDACRQISELICRPVDVVMQNIGGPSPEVLERYAASTSTACARRFPATPSWSRATLAGSIARHDRRPFPSPSGTPRPTPALTEPRGSATCSLCDVFSCDGFGVERGRRAAPARARFSCLSRSWRARAFSVLGGYVAAARAAALSRIR